MKDMAIYVELQIGEACEACDCELVLISRAGDAELYLECDCGRWACLAPADASGAVASAA